MGKASCGCMKSEKTVRWLTSIMEWYQGSKWWGWLKLWDLVHGPVTLERS